MLPSINLEKIAVKMFSAIVGGCTLTFVLLVVVLMFIVMMNDARKMPKCDAMKKEMPKKKIIN